MLSCGFVYALNYSFYSIDITIEVLTLNSEL